MKYNKLSKLLTVKLSGNFFLVILTRYDVGPWDNIKALRAKNNSALNVQNKYTATLFLVLPEFTTCMYDLLSTSRLGED